MEHASCGLRGGPGITSTSPLVVDWVNLEGFTPARIEADSQGQTKASNFILIYSKSDPAACATDAETAIKATRTVYYTQFHALLTEQDGEQKTGSLADFLAKSL